MTHIPPDPPQYTFPSTSTFMPSSCRREFQTVPPSRRDVANITLERPVGLVPLKAYAASVGMPPSTLWTHVRAGKVDAVKIGERWFVKDQAIHVINSDGSGDAVLVSLILLSLECPKPEAVLVKNQVFGESTHRGGRPPLVVDFVAVCGAVQRACQ